ncbi:MAG: substrate-binding domain-containing protein [Verrucomicrobiota bacterium]
MSLQQNPQQASGHLPQKQQAFLRIKELIDQGKFSQQGLLPSIRKIADITGFNRDAVWRALSDLEQNGYIRATANKRYEIHPAVTATQLRTLNVALVTVGEGAIRFAGLQRFRNSLNRLEKLTGIYAHLHCAIDARDINPAWFDGMDAAIFGGYFEHSERLSELNLKIPTIGIINNDDFITDVQVHTDNIYGGRLAAKRLFESGVAQPCIIGSTRPATERQTTLRKLGFQTGWVEAGGKLEQIEEEFIRSENYFVNIKRLEGIIRDKQNCDGYFGLSKEVSINLLHIFEENGAKIPDDVKVISFDGTFDGLKTNPPLTYIKQNFEEMAEIAAERIRILCSSREPAATEHLLVKPELISRDSA